MGRVGSPVARIPHPDHLGGILADLDRRLRAHESGSWVYGLLPLVSTSGNSAQQNQGVPASGNFTGFGAWFDVAMATPCQFTAIRPSTLFWLSYAPSCSTRTSAAT